MIADHHKTNGATVAESWHIRAVCLPDDDQVEEGWVYEGRWHNRPVPNAEELPGGWVIPGLVDAHAHLSMDFNRTGLPMGSDPLIVANMAAQLSAGVLVVRDTGAVPGAKLDLNPPCGPRVLASGRFLAPAGRYYAPLYEGVEADEVIAAALTEVDHGVTWIKVIADFPGPDGNWFAPQVNYPPEILHALVDAVHAAGARVAAHVSGPFVAEVIRAGVDSIEHGPMIDRNLLAEMGDQGTAWTPTLLTVAGVLDQLATSANPLATISREMLARLQETLPLAAQLGIPLLTGTDEGAHGSIGLEVAQLRRFGLSASAALAAASTNARAYLGLPTFGAGAPADLVTFATDPRNEPQTLAKPAAVLLGGKRVV